MPEGPLQDLKYAAQAVWQETQASLAEGKQRMQDYSKRSESCNEVINMLKALPDRPSHNIMLPLGKAAYIPARLADPERCHVTLGHGVQMECSREEAIAILEQQLQGLNGDMHIMKGEMEVLERRLLIAEAALQAPLQGGDDMTDIREEEDVTLLSEEPSHIDAHVFPSSSAAPDSLLPDDSQSEHLEGSEGAKSGRRRSVTFAEAPMVGGPGRGGQPGSPGLRKGFFGKPKPVLKRTSSISDDSSSPVDRAVQEQTGAAGPAGAEQAQSRAEEARDEAFSGHIVERLVSPGAQLPRMHTMKDAAAGQVWGESQSEGLPDERQRDIRKVSRFRQQRQKPA